MLPTAHSFHLKLSSLTTSAKMSNMTLMTPFNAGQTLTIGGVPRYNATRFSVNIGPNEDDIALHVNPRFNYYSDCKRIVFNSLQGGNWGQEIRDENFPFSHGVEFKIIIKFTDKEFVVTLSDGSIVVFPNRIGEEQYSVITVEDVHIKSFKIE